MSLLTRAASKFDAAFAALPTDARQRVALALYRFWPTWQQYQRDLEPLNSDAGIKAATWDAMIAIAWQLVKRRERAFDFSAKEYAELRVKMPTLSQFFDVLGASLRGEPAPAAIDVAPPAPKRKAIR